MNDLVKHVLNTLIFNIVCLWGPSVTIIKQ